MDTATAYWRLTRNFDFDFQYHIKRDRHDVVWGCGYRNDEEN